MIIDALALRGSPAFPFRPGAPISPGIPMALTPARRETLEARIKTLDGLLEGLQRDLSRIPRLLVLLVLAVPAGIVWSWVAVVFVVFSVLTLVGTSIYVTWGHQNEYRAERDLIRREVSEGDRPRARESM